MEYRIRRDVSDDPILAAAYGEPIVTLVPGVIRRNKPKALKWLEVARTKWKYPGAWLEQREDDKSEWEKVDG